MASLLPVPKARFFDANGEPLAGGKVFTYQAGTNVLQSSYTDQSGLVANTNPVILDARGEANIWLVGTYKVVLQDSAGVQQWSVDNIQDIQTAIGGAYGNIQNVWAGTSSGTANMLTLSPSPALTSIPVGQRIRFNVFQNNTAGATVNTSNLGDIALRKIKNGTLVALEANDLVANTIATIDYNGSQWQLNNDAEDTILDRSITPQLQTFPYKARVLSGLIISNNTTDANNDIDIATGYASDAIGYSYQLTSIMTKQIDTTFVAGNNAGGLFAGTKTANTNYSVWLIRNTTTSVMDAGFSVTATASDIPLGWTKVARLGWIRTSAANNILEFRQTGDIFLYKTPIAQGVVVGSTRTLITLPAPPNLESQLRIDTFAASAANQFIFQPTYETDAAPNFLGVAPGFSQYHATNARAAGDFNIITDNSSQIAARATTAGETVGFVVKGWYDRRGRDE